MSQISNIDDLLMGVGNSQQPATPEHKEQSIEETESVDEIDSNTPKYDSEPETETDDYQDEDKESEVDKVSDKVDKEEFEEDEYGNKKERIPRGMKERLDRKEKQFQREIEQRDMELQALRQQLMERGASREVQDAVKDFKYNPDQEVSWEQQLSDFVKQTVNNMQSEQHQRARQEQEVASHRQFQKKFTQGMDRFDDFREVVGSKPIDDAMTLSLRAMDDPSAFIYAACKRHPQEIERISKLQDPYARMVEMGKLEERMRRNKPSTNAPRPLGRTREDATTKPVVKEKDTTGDDLLAKADAKRLSIVRNRHKNNR